MTQISEQNFHEILSVGCKMKEVIIVLTRQVLILRACGERCFRNEKKVAIEKEEAIQKANIGGM